MCTSQLQHFVSTQVVEIDLIGASAGAVAALLLAHADDTTWMQSASLTLNLYVRLHELLASLRLRRDAAALAPEADAAWKRCQEVRLPQNMIAVRAAFIQASHRALVKATGDVFLITYSMLGQDLLLIETGPHRCS